MVHHSHGCFKGQIESDHGVTARDWQMHPVQDLG